MEQIQHCIFIASNYTNNKRKGLHYLYNETNIDIVLKLLDRFKENEGVAPYFVTTDNVSIESVQKKDPFFKNVDIKEGTEKNALDNFIKSINNLINSFDMCILFLSRNSHRFSEIKKILLLFYCEYIRVYGKYPFKDSPLIQGNSIVFKSLNEEFKKDPRISDFTMLKSTKEEIVFSKFLNSEGGFNLLNNSLNIYFKIFKLSNKELDDWYEGFISICQKEKNFQIDGTNKVTKHYIKECYNCPLR